MRLVIDLSQGRAGVTATVVRTGRAPDTLLSAGDRSRAKAAADVRQVIDTELRNWTSKRPLTVHVSAPAPKKARRGSR